MEERPSDVNQESALGRWEQVVRRPDRCLRPFVRAYKGYAHRNGAPPRSRHVPTGGVGLIIGFGSGLQVIGPEALDDYSAYRTSFIAGMHDTYSDSQWLGHSHGVQVDFTPIGARAFFGIPMHTLANRVIEFEDVLSAEARCLVERLRETPGWDSRFRILEASIATRIVAGREPSRQVAWAWSEMEGRHGAVSIRELADELGWSQKHLIAGFREEVGLPPKTAARVLRFNRVLRALERTAKPDWAEIAVDEGYYDQSHLIRDFREFAGVTPTEFVTLRRGDGDLSPD